MFTRNLDPIQNSVTLRSVYLGGSVTRGHTVHKEVLDFAIFMTNEVHIFQPSPIFKDALQLNNTYKRLSQKSRKDLKKIAANPIITLCFL